MAKKSAGRPEFRPTPRIRQKVEQLIGCGMSQDAVARAIGISTPTLVKHFAEELANGVATKRSEIIGMLFKSAKSGNVTAQKKLEEMNRLAAAAEAMAGLPEQPPKAEPMGKKAQTLAAAERVEPTFAPPSAPKLVVNNGS
jgi:predicted RNA-binding Zn ribbon-like protein